jgi:hypothetical protein
MNTGRASHINIRVVKVPKQEPRLQSMVSSIVIASDEDDIVSIPPLAGKRRRASTESESFDSDTEPRFALDMPERLRTHRPAKATATGRISQYIHETAQYNNQVHPGQAKRGSGTQTPPDKAKWHAFFPLGKDQSIDTAMIDRCDKMIAEGRSLPMYKVSPAHIGAESEPIAE